MHNRIILVILVGVLVTFTAAWASCSGKSGGGGGVDAGWADAGRDGGPGDDARVDAGPNPDGGSQAATRTRFNITGGGETSSSVNFRARLSIGAPQPYGRTAGSGRVLQTGPKPSP